MTQDVVEAVLGIAELCRRDHLALSGIDKAILTQPLHADDVRWDGGVREMAGSASSLHVTISVISRTLGDHRGAIVSRFAESTYRGFFDAASDGLPLTNLYLVKEWFNFSVEENYPDAGPTFISFATTYWTFKVLAKRLMLSDLPPVACHLITFVDSLVGPLFFPVASPLPPLDPAMRERDQRRFLRKFAPRLDIEQFIGGNPILTRDRNRFN